jgi:aminoglycoside 2'-N-acetyltransferase I
VTEARPSVLEIATADLTAAQIAGLWSLVRAAWPAGGFDQHDFDHALGGRHWLIEVDGRIVSHASVVPRELYLGERALAAGYLEAVATLPELEHRGLGSAVVAAAGEHITATSELGALSTGRHHFYERLGWRRWLGPTFVRTPDGPLRTADDDGSILVLPTPTSPTLDLTVPLTCDWRSGDVW